MKFCRACGSALGQTAAAMPTGGGGPMSPPPTGGVLGAIGGAPMMSPVGAPMMAPPMSAAIAPTMAPASMMPPGGMPSTAPGVVPPPGPMAPIGGSSPKVVVSASAQTPSPPAQGNMITCPRCGTPTPVGFAYCQQCGLHMQAMQPTDPGQNPRPRMPSAPGMETASGGRSLVGPLPASNVSIDPQGATLATDGVRAGSIAMPAGRAAPVAGPAWGTAILVNRDGSDGQRFSLVGEYAVVGRAGADIAFDEDRFLARQHARFERTGDGVKVLSLDTLNGVFKKADLPVELVDGMTLLVGREVLRYERVDPEETKVHPLIRHGVALFGSPPREPWGRLVAIVPSGGWRDVRHLAGEEVVLGREEGDIVFRDDAFMSRRHAAVTWDGRKAQITDLGSSNGTFVRITGPTPIKHGDHVRMGDQLLRIELGK